MRGKGFGVVLPLTLPSDIDLCGFGGPLGTCCRRVYLVCSRLPRLLAEKLSRQRAGGSSAECRVWRVSTVCREPAWLPAGGDGASRLWSHGSLSGGCCCVNELMISIRPGAKIRSARQLQYSIDKLKCSLARD